MQEKTYRRLAKIGFAFTLYYILESIYADILVPIHFRLDLVFTDLPSFLLFAGLVILICGAGALVLVPLWYYGWKKKE